MNSRPVISVIVANYNNGLYIRDCLDSILKQSYKDIEIIISDDASTDHSPDIIRHYEKKCPGIVRGVFASFNRGAAQTRHDAILQAKGKFITTLDSDDYYYDPQKLEKEMELILHYKGKSSRDIIAYSNIVLVKEDKALIRFQGSPDTIKEGFIFNDIITRSCMIPRDFVFKRDAYFKVGGYDVMFKTHEDWDLKIRLAARYKFYYTGINGTSYRLHSEGLSSAPHRFKSRNLWQVFNKNIYLMSNPLEREKTKGTFILFMEKRDRNFLDNLFNRFQLKSREDRKLKAMRFYFKNLIRNFGLAGFCLFFKELIRKRDKYAGI